MTSFIGLRRLCSVLVVALILMGALGRPAAAREDFWAFDDIRFSGLGAFATRYVYVPQGSRWEDTFLIAYAATDGRAHVAVRIDDRTVYQSDIDHPQFLTIPIGTLEAGFHRIDVRASLSLEKPEEAQAINYCVEEMRIPLILQRMYVTYREVLSDEQFLSALPDTLFNPQKPRQRPWRMAVVVAPDDLAGISAAARLASGLNAATPMNVMHAAATEEGDADFMLDILHDPNLAAQASVDFLPPSGEVDDLGASRNPNNPPAQTWADPPTLRIFYRTQEGLDAAVNALLNGAYRGQMDTMTADFDGSVAPPQWGGIVDFPTLASLGIGDIEIEGTGSRSVVLAYPPAWEPIGVPEGQIIVRSQDGLMQGSQMQVWVEDSLAGSTRLDRLVAGDIQRAIPFQASRVPPDSVIGVRFEAALVTTTDCRPGVKGKVWVDAERSFINLPHRLKDGLGSMSAALVGRPVIAIGQTSPGVVSAVLALSANLGAFTGGLPVPIEVVDGDSSATITIDVDLEDFRKELLSQDEALYLPELADGVLLMQDGGGYRILAARGESLHLLSRHWARIELSLTSGTVTALLTPSGELIQLEIRPVSEELVMFDRSDPIPWIIVAAAVLLATVAAVMLFLRFGRRRSG